VHWIAGPLSARYVALATGGRPPTAKALREAQDRIVAATAHLAHTDGTNQFFIDLIAASRTRPGSRLTRWWPGPTIAGTTGRRVHPDGVACIVYMGIRSAKRSTPEPGRSRSDV
jgi:hypothetical protein